MMQNNVFCDDSLNIVKKYRYDIELANFYN